jgi:hypothetical protein
MNRFIEKTAKIFVYITIIVGILTISTAAHELSHYFDIKDDVMVQDICLMNIPIDTFPDGAYGYVRNLNYGKEMQTSEIKATIIGFVVGIFLVLCLGYTIKHKEVK